MENGSRKLVSALLPVTYVEALLLEAAGLKRSQIAERLDVHPAASGTLLKIARAKLLNACSQSTAGSTPENGVRLFGPARHPCLIPSSPCQAIYQRPMVNLRSALGPHLLRD